MVRDCHPSLMSDSVLRYLTYYNKTSAFSNYWNRTNLHSSFKHNDIGCYNNWYI